MVRLDSGYRASNVKNMVRLDCGYRASNVKNTVRLDSGFIILDLVYFYTLFLGI